MYLAHITKVSNERIEQKLKDHCCMVAQYTSNQLKTLGFEALGYLVGLLHDMGKYSDAFQEYLEKSFQGEDVKRGTVNHTFAGVIYMMEQFHQGKKTVYETIACEVIAFAMGSHHGEFDVTTLDTKSGFEHRMNYDKDQLEYDQVVIRYFEDCVNEEEILDLFHKATEEVHRFYNQLKDTLLDKKQSMKQRDFIVGMLCRMVLSALIDSDRRDTAEFMMQSSYHRTTIVQDKWQEQLSYLESKLKEFSYDSPINQVRSEISKQCNDFADRGDGIYKIGVPTGGGKTLSTLRYSLRLAKQTNKEHIIFLIPLLSVLDQNSKVISEFCKDCSLILEHHSNVIVPQEKEELDQYELLAENWNAPIIISTVYQFLMTLFSNKTTAIRRMQALKNSVIVIDEAQSIPFKMTYQFNMALNFLHKFCNTTVVLSSATQPCFEQVEFPLWFSENPDLVRLDSKSLQVFERTRIINMITPEGMTLDEIADLNRNILQTESSVLTICNTKKTARNLYNLLKLQNVGKEYVLFHLSTSMCTRHRLSVLREIKECLEAGCKMICVSTQLVEAGIDFSFASVVRIEAGIDNLAQAAGRCNRNFDYGKLCNVYLVKLKEENIQKLQDIILAQKSTTDLLIAYERNKEQFQNTLLSEESIQYYYQSLFYQLEKTRTFYNLVKDKQGEVEELFELLGSNDKYNHRHDYQGRYFLKQAFQTAGSLFTVFDTNTTDIIVPYNEEARELIAEVQSAHMQYNLADLKECIRKLKPYTIQLWQYEKEKLMQDGLLYSDPSGHLYFIQQQCYNMETGYNPEVYLF